jgi:2-oxoglutarate dehydrogenase complex dihydrolipoamide succinyltransferase (E2) component
MKVTVVMPQLGESIAEGEVVAWLKREGDAVERDEALVEVKTDKATVEVPATASGTLGEILVQEGETVAVGAKIASIETSSDRASVAVERPMPQARLVRETPRRKADETPSPKKEQPPVEPLAPKTEEEPAPEATEGIRMTPLARRLAREKGIDPSTITGSGAGGRITREDVLAAVHEDGEEPAGEAKADEEVKTGPDDEIVSLSSMRRRIASRLVHSSQTIPHVTTVIEVDMTGVNALRKEHKEAFEKEGIKLTYLPFILRAVVLALKEYPEINSSWGGDKILLHKKIHLGIAVAVEGGLAAPVIRDANDLSVRELAKRLSEVAEHARAGKLSASEAQGGTFTITNPGMFGAVFSTPIINPPEAAILGVCRIAETPVVRDGKVVVRWMTHLCLSYDHRIADGEKALRFLGHIRESLEKADFDLK